MEIKMFKAKSIPGPDAEILKTFKNKTYEELDLREIPNPISYVFPEELKDKHWHNIYNAFVKEADPKRILEPLAKSAEDLYEES